MLHGPEMKRITFSNCIREREGHYPWFHIALETASRQIRDFHVPFGHPKALRLIHTEGRSQDQRVKPFGLAGSRRTTPRL
jgi:hypothetical protein